jgi:hypothetical protein
VPHFSRTIDVSLRQVLRVRSIYQEKCSTWYSYAKLDYFPAQNSMPLAFGENHPVGGKLQDRTELNLTLAAAVDSFL